MPIITLVFIALSVLTTAAGLPCCLGCVNWVAVPMSLATVGMGLAGLALDKRDDGKINDAKLYIAAIVVGVLCAVIGAVRCTMGGGVV